MQYTYTTIRLYNAWFFTRFFLPPIDHNNCSVLYIHASNKGWWKRYKWRMCVPIFAVAGGEIKRLNHTRIIWRSDKSSIWRFFSMLQFVVSPSPYRHRTTIYIMILYVFIATDETDLRRFYTFMYKLLANKNSSITTYGFENRDNN